MPTPKRIVSPCSTEAVETFLLGTSGRTLFLTERAEMPGGPERDDGLSGSVHRAALPAAHSAFRALKSKRSEGAAVQWQLRRPAKTGAHSRLLVSCGPLPVRGSTVCRIEPSTSFVDRPDDIRLGNENRSANFLLPEPARKS